jgi:hypothetical protein
MIRKALTVLCGLLAAATLLEAQARGAKTDSVTGTWIGDLTPEGGPEPRTITMQLTFDGKRAVTGTFTGFPTPGDVKNGTYDPKTSALKLELGKVGEPEVLLVIEGPVKEGAVSGKLGGQVTGTFKLTKQPAKKP